jgi:hypothetical protein
MATVDAKRLVINNTLARSGTTHTCPMTKINYWHECPVFSCPANISQLNPGLGGCFLQLGKPTIVDASRYLRITTHEVKRRYRRGMQRISKFLQFYHWLQDFREQTVKPHCSRCGVALTNTAGTCINYRRCQLRIKLLKRAKSLHPINLSVLAINNYEFWHIVLAQRQNKFAILSQRLFIRAERRLARLTTTGN